VSNNKGRLGAGYRTHAFELFVTECKNRVNQQRGPSDRRPVASSDSGQGFCTLDVPETRSVPETGVADARDVDAAAPSMLYWFKVKKSADGMTTFTPMEIDNDSGIGTQFEVVDVNGDKHPDVIISNKKGTFLLEQVRP